MPLDYAFPALHLFKRYIAQKEVAFYRFSDYLLRGDVMANSGGNISRRDFLKLAGIGLLALAWRAAPRPLSNLLRYTEKAYGLDEFNINNLVSEAFIGMQPLCFDEAGNLGVRAGGYFDSGGSRVEPGQALGDVHLKPTLYNSLHHSEKDMMEEVKIFVVHSDDGPRIVNGITRTALNTWYSLNGGTTMPSVHWCIDEFPITPASESNPGVGYGEAFGILQTQAASGDVMHPYEGAHVSIARIDTGREQTLRLYKELDIVSNLPEALLPYPQHLSRVSVAAEQVGANFDLNFPHQFPPGSQLSNMLSLSVLLMNTYNLSPWDIVGHNEVQEHSDPGDAYMLLLRYCLGIAGLTGLVKEDAVFRGASNVQDYFETVKEYFIACDRFSNRDKAFEYFGIVNQIIKPGYHTRIPTATTQVIPI